MTDVPTPALGDLSSVLAAPHEQALAALESGPSGAAGAVAWLSAHLAAADCVVHAAVKQALPRRPPTGA